MRVFLDPGIYNCLNMGGVAMVQMAITRLTQQWPDATFDILTDGPSALAQHCPGARPVPHEYLNTWLADRSLLGQLHDYLPQPVSQRLIDLKNGARRSRPGLVDAAVLLRARLTRQSVDAFQAFRSAVYGADLVVVSGAGGLNDSFPGYTREICTILDMAAGKRIPAALFGQGLGPLHNPSARARLGRALQQVAIIGVRERRVGPALLRELGVSAERIVISGDDAIELAYRERPETPGNGIGINLRLAAYTAVGQETVAQIRPVLQAFAHDHGAPLLPLPIALHQRSPDQEVIKQLLAGYDDASDGGAHLDTPRKVIEQAGRCRVIVTGAYHAAVFGLSQGVPVICLAQSELYADKFFGLADLFGAGCSVLMLDAPALGARLRSALDTAWSNADQLRAPLLEAAARQIEAGQKAYAALRAAQNHRRAA